MIVKMNSNTKKNNKKSMAHHIFHSYYTIFYLYLYIETKNHIDNKLSCFVEIYY